MGDAAEQLQPELLTADEVAALLRVDRKTVYAMIQDGQIPGVRRLRRIIRFHRATVVAWLASDNQAVSRPRRK